MDNFDFAEPVDDFNRYMPGLISYQFDPSKEKYKNMLRIVAYDIRNARRLRKVAKTCRDFGNRVEFSVFECDLDEKKFSELWDILVDIIDPDEDSILVYNICGSCVKGIKSMGIVSRPEKPLLYFV